MTRKGDTVDDIMRNINKEIENMKKLSMKGLIQAAMVIRRDMEKTSPTIPVDTGNLRNSWFIRQFLDASCPTVMFGFTASYAIFVHENVGAKVWQRMGSGPKFFEASIRRNQDKILNIIANPVKTRAPKGSSTKKAAA